MSAARKAVFDHEGNVGNALVDFPHISVGGERGHGHLNAGTHRPAAEAVAIIENTVGYGQHGVRPFVVNGSGSGPCIAEKAVAVTCREAHEADVGILKLETVVVA